MSGIVAYMALTVSAVTLGFTYWAHRRAEQQLRRCRAYAAIAEQAADRAEKAAKEAQEWANLRSWGHNRTVA